MRKFPVSQPQAIRDLGLAAGAGASDPALALPRCVAACARGPEPLGETAFSWDPPADHRFDAAHAAAGLRHVEQRHRGRRRAVFLPPA